MLPIAGDTPNTFELVIGLILLGLLLGSISVWFWIISKKLKQQPLLPTEARLPARWGIGLILATGVLWILCQIGVARFVAASPADPLADSDAPAATVGLSDDQGDLIPIEPKPVAPAFSSRQSITVVTWASVLFLALLPIPLWLSGRYTLADLGLHSHGVLLNLARGVATCLALAPACYGLMFIAVRLWPPKDHPLQDMLKTTTLTPELVILAILSAVVLAPLTEEILFRGLLLPWLNSRLNLNQPTPSLGIASLEPLPDETTAPPPPRPSSRPIPMAWALPNIFTSVLFAGLHGAQWPSPVPLVVLSLGLGWLATRTGSLWAPIGLHAAFNGISTSMMLLIQAGGLSPQTQLNTPGAPKLNPAITIMHEAGPDLPRLSMKFSQIPADFPWCESTSGL